MKQYVIRMKGRFSRATLRAFHANDTLKACIRTGCLTLGPINVRPRGSVTIGEYAFSKWETALRLAEKIGAIEISVISDKPVKKKVTPVVVEPVVIFDEIEPEPPKNIEADVPVEEEVVPDPEPVEELTADTSVEYTGYTGKKRGRKKGKLEE